MREAPVVWRQAALGCEGGAGVCRSRLGVPEGGGVGVMARSRRWRASEAEGSKLAAVVGVGCAVVWAAGVARRLKGREGWGEWKKDAKKG